MIQKKTAKFAIYLFLILGLLTIMTPLYITVVTTFKTASESTKSFFTFPGSLYLDSYKEILRNPKFYYALRNTFGITITALAGNMLIMPMMSYAISRSMGTSRIYRGIYYFLLMGIFIPFQVRMMPLVKLMSALHLTNAFGVVVLYIAYATCESVFLYVGFLASIPTELEEAAYIDGASTIQSYRSVVFPLLKPMMATVLIREGLMMWNDFMMPLVMLNRNPSSWTLTIFQYNFQSEFNIDYGLTFTCFVLSSLPIIIFYIFMQKNIIGGMTSGAVKL
ncbi:sugar ABC transporter permease [Clostridium sp. chh4-2]|uniref:carbohydrate ABC transporter permease n=1 Tax=Clostridium sp. chh4-2 TaxID=2067550 RepID=UPI000CCE766C|nr:carbohydrate ABC transporter permease [Clostridium sp. chh4-2]PNV61980.1 sugar ABC transporter permease [Clostridium sp. chh4-2]